MKLKIHLIFASLLLVSASMSFSSCIGEDWEADKSLVLTDESHGSLTNGNVVATGKVEKLTHNSVTILYSANYNYKESLVIEPGIVISTINKDKYNLLASYSGVYCFVNKNSSFSTNSDCYMNLANLAPNTTYYYRAYAKTADGGEHYGDVKSFTTPKEDNTAGVAVNLGLSVKWANKNIGASQPEYAGDSFYWGGTVACNEAYQADWHGSSLSELKYQGFIDNNNNLTSAYDAATQIWGSQWRMPTKEEYQELISQCIWTKITKNGIPVFKVQGPNNNIIYFPIEYHWTSTALEHSSYELYLYAESPEIKDAYRRYLSYIRPVMK